MKPYLSLKRRLAIFLVATVLALPVLSTLGMNLSARLARGAAEPRVVAVNWNSGPSTSDPGPL